MPLQSIQIGAAFLLAVLYIPFFTGAATSPRWCLLSLVVPVILIAYYQLIRITTPLLLLIAFFLYSCITLKWSYHDQAPFYLIRLAILIEIFILGSLFDDLKNIFIGLALGITVSSVFVIVGVPGGLFVNVNTLAENAVLVLVGVCVYKLWWLIPGLLPSIFLNGSRGAFITLCIIFGFWLWQKSKYYTFIWLVMMIPVGILLALYRPETISERFTIWREILETFNIFGQGIGTFSLYSYYNIINTRPMYAHNDLLQIAFELGMIGASLIALFFVTIMQVSKNEKYIVGTFIIISMFAFPLYFPVSAFIVFLVCGYLSRNKHGLFLYDYKSGMGLL